jgi:cephalosporin hydroxylase
MTPKSDQGLHYAGPDERFLPVDDATRDALDRFQEVFYFRNIWRRRQWLGVPCHQNPMDMWVMQEILHEVGPDLVIETGTRHGGSALFYASILSFAGDGRVVTVDHRSHFLQETSGWSENERTARSHPIFRERVTTLTGSSTSEEIGAQLRAAAEQASCVLVVLDSDHEKEHVLRELRATADLVTPGSYLVVQDTHLGQTVPWDRGEGPFEAVHEFLAIDDRFEIDRTREECLFTWFPDGFLRRVR